MVGIITLRYIIQITRIPITIKKNFLIHSKKIYRYQSQKPDFQYQNI